MRITRYCCIRNKKITRNGELIFEDQQSDLDAFLDKAYGFLKPDYPKFYKMDRLSKLGFLAAEVLLHDHVLRNCSGENVGLVLANAAASLDTDLRYAESAKTMASPALFVYTLPNIVAGEICIRHKLKGENAFFISERFNSDLMAKYVTMVLGSNSASSIKANVCIAGWIDVLEEHHDVFLYLAEKNAVSGYLNSPEQLDELYNQ